MDPDTADRQPDRTASSVEGLANDPLRELPDPGGALSALTESPKRCLIVPILHASISEEESMEARIVDLKTLFETEVSYRIPQFQRPYAWKRKKQWEPLWDDVRESCERLLNWEGDGEPPPHFMGAIVLQPRSHATGEVVKSIVLQHCNC